MRKTIWILPLFLLSWCMSCNNAPTSYIVKGFISDSLFYGSTIYINRQDDKINVDSTVVDQGHFVFEGVADTAFLCRIDAGRNYASFILENGEIEINFEKHLGTPTTPLNKKYNHIYHISDSLQSSYTSKYDQIKLKTDDTAVQSRLLREAFETEYLPLWVKLYEEWFLDNNNNAIGLYVLS